MPRTPDTLAVARRREREKLVVSQMVALYCAGHHACGAQTETAFCGEALCPDCAELDRFAVARTAACRKMATKTSCKNCERQCYPPAMEERIRTPHAAPPPRRGRAAHAGKVGASFARAVTKPATQPPLGRAPRP